MTEHGERPDLGARYTPEDKQILHWLGEQSSAQFGQMQRLAARYSAFRERLVDREQLSVQRMRKKKEKWQQAGLIAYKTFLTNQK